jgi:hypothetical protein
MGRIDARAAAIAEELGVPHVDLRPILTPNLDHYFDMFHYTPRGAAAVGQTVAQALLGVQPPESPPRPSRTQSRVPAGADELA